MPCDTIIRPNETPAARKERVNTAVKRIEAFLQRGKLRLVIDKKTGAAAFAGMTDEELRVAKDGLMDSCVLRKLQVSGSFAYRQALAKAEAAAGRSLNMDAVAAGMHSHDGGKTFGGH